VAVGQRTAVGVALALRTNDIIKFLFHELGQHAEPDADAERQHPLLAAPTSSPSASWTRAGNTASYAIAAYATDTVSLTAVPPSIFGGSPRTLPTGTDAAGGTAVFKFYELRDNLGRRDGVVRHRSGGKPYD
jgi:hypothetical protein